jgi:hypothetical protein
VDFIYCEKFNSEYMILRGLLILFAIGCLLSIQNCSPTTDELGDAPSSVILKGGIFGVIRQSQDHFSWHETDGANVSSSVKFQLTTNTNLDSISWVFPGATPDRLEGSLQAQTEFQGYGSFQPYVAIKSIDSTSSKITRIRIDSIFSNPIKVNYNVDDWNSFTTSGPDVWDNFGTSNILLGRDTLVDQSTDSIIIKKRFEGLNGSDSKLKFSYRINQNMPSNIKTGDNKKFSVIIDGFERFSARGIKNKQFYDVSIPLKNKDQFDMGIVRYPSLYTTEWEISADDPTSIDQETITMYQPITNENTLVGYPSVTASTTVMLNFGSYNFGTVSSGYELVENGDPITLLEGKYKLEFTLERGLPIRYSLEENISLDDNEVRFDLYIYDFRLEF